MRLPDKGSNDQTLKPVDITRPGGRCGDTAVRAAEYHGKPEESVWLPNGVAKAWMEYVKTGAVGDTTPPPPPFSVRATQVGDEGREITWDAEADFKVASAASSSCATGKNSLPKCPRKIAAGKIGRPLFQSMTYHDTPDQPMPRCASGTPWPERTRNTLMP